MGYDIAALITVFIAGIAIGIYVTSQIEIRLSRRTRLSPTKISISYVEQGPGYFYGMYIYNDSNRYVKLSNIKEANGVLKSLGITDKIPESISERHSVTTLNRISGQFNEEHGKYCCFDWDQCMDVS